MAGEAYKPIGPLAEEEITRLRAEYALSPQSNDVRRCLRTIETLQAALAAERERADRASYLSFELRQGLAKMAEYYHESQGHRQRLEFCPDAVCAGVRQNCQVADDFLERPTASDTPPDSHT